MTLKSNFWSLKGQISSDTAIPRGTGRHYSVTPNQPPSLYSYYDRDLANDFTFGFIRDLEIAGIDYSFRPEIAIDQLYFDVTGRKIEKINIFTK